MMDKATRSLFYQILALLGIGLVVAGAMLLVGCATPSAASSNATNPAVTPAQDGQGNTQTVETDTTSNTHQRTSQGEAVAGDAGRDTVITQNGISSGTIRLVVIGIAMALGMGLFVACILMLADFTITTPAHYMIFGVGILGLLLTIGAAIYAVQIHGGA